MTPRKETIMSRIKKCFALGKSPNEHEAAAALAKARALMDEYGISAQDVLASQASEGKSQSGARYRPPTWEGALAKNVCATFGCRMIYLPARWPDSKGRWAFVGCGPGPDIAKYAFDVLLRQAKKARRHYTKVKLRRCKISTKARRADMFCLGWIMTASSKIPALAVPEENDRAIKAYYAEHYPQTADLSLVNRCKTGRRIQDFINGRLEGANSILDHGVCGMPPGGRRLLEVS